MNKVRLKAPDGVTSIQIVNKGYAVSAEGFVEVDEDHVPLAYGHGCTVAAEVAPEAPLSKDEA